MNKSLLKQIFTYFSKVYHLGEKIKGVKDKRIDPDIKTSTVALTVLMGFILQVPSFNRLEHWVRKGKFKKIFPPRTKMPSIDTVRLVLDKTDLCSITTIGNDIVKTAIKNKVLRGGTVDQYRVCAIDGVELFESTEKHCDDCLTRIDKAGVIHYFHRSVTCMTVGSDPHIIFGEEMLRPKKDGSNKDEGELTGGKRLIEKLHDEFGHFCDIIVADALYMKAPWIQKVLSVGMDAVVRVKDERLHIVKEAIALFNTCKADKEWTINQTGNKKIVVTAWDNSEFEMDGLSDTVRFVKFIEKICKGDKVEFKEVWIVTTNKYIDVKTLWKIIHSRWHIENNGFHQLKGEWNMSHCFLHSSTGTEAVLIFMIIAFNLMQLFFFRCLRGFKEKGLIQAEIIEDLRDELAVYSYCSINLTSIIQT